MRGDGCAADRFGRVAVRWGGQGTKHDGADDARRRGRVAGWKIGHSDGDERGGVGDQHCRTRLLFRGEVDVSTGLDIGDARQPAVKVPDVSLQGGMAFCSTVRSWIW